MYFFFCFKVMKHQKREDSLRTLLRLIKSQAFLGKKLAESWPGDEIILGGGQCPKSFQ